MKRLDVFHVAGWLVMLTMLIGSIAELVRYRGAGEIGIVSFMVFVISMYIFNCYRTKKATGSWPFWRS
jgi:hypothetical protein